MTADEKGRVLREDGTSVDGLYAVGNAAANACGTFYPGPARPSARESCSPTWPRWMLWIVPAANDPSTSSGMPTPTELSCLGPALAHARHRGSAFGVRHLIREPLLSALAAIEAVYARQRYHKK